MKHVFICLALVFALPAQATTYTFDLIFKNDRVFELKNGFDTCSSRETCYPDDFRLANGFFNDLEPGESTTATVDFDAGTAMIAGWNVAGKKIQDGISLAHFFSTAPTGSTIFTADSVTVSSEGPSGFNAGIYCDPSKPAAGMPAGFCGFYGYEANFEVLSVTEVPLPATALMLLSALGILGAARRKRAS